MKNDAAEQQTGGSEGRPRYQNHVAVAIVLVVAGIAVALGQYKVPSVMPALMETFGMDMASTSMLMSVFTFVGIVLALPAGFLARRIGAKNLMVIAVAVLVVGTVVGAFATSGTMLVASRAIEGVGLVTCGVCAPLVIRGYSAPTRVGFVTGIWALWISLGSFFGGVLTPSLFGVVGFQGTWLVMAAIAAAAGAMLLLYLKTPEGGIFESVAKRAPQDAAVPRARVRDLFTRDLLLILGGFLMFNMVLISMLTYSPTFLQGEGMDPTLSGFASTLPMLLAVVTSPLFGVLADKTGRIKLLQVVSMLAMGPCACVLLTTASPALWVAAVVMGLVGLGAPTMFLITYPLSVSRVELMPIAMGLLVMVQSLGQFLGALVAPMVLAGGWMALGLFVMVLGLVGTGLLALARMKPAPAA